MKKLSEYYHLPTPKRWRQAGDAIMTLGMSITGQQMWQGNHTVATVALVLAWLGKTITNFATDTTTDKT